MPKRIVSLVLILFLFGTMISVEIRAAETADSLLSQQTARGLLLRSMVLPGWVGVNTG